MAFKKDSGAIYRVNDNTINEDVPILVQRVMLGDMPPPSCQPIVLHPHIDNLARSVFGERHQTYTPRGLDVVQTCTYIISLPTHNEFYA